MNILSLALQAPGQRSFPEIRDIEPPVDVFPWPIWMVVLVGIVLLLVLIGVIVGVFLLTRRKPIVIPPTPREVAVRELERLREKVGVLDPYDFSVAVSDVLRTFIGQQYYLRATQQTSPEFLASISEAPQFSDDDRGLLSHFMDRCDLIKFARINATSEDSAELLQRAIAFVQGART